MSGARILVHDRSGSLADQIRSLTSGFAPAPEVVACDRPSTLADLLTEETFDVLVAGPGLDSRAGWERLRIIREERPAMSIVLGLIDPDAHPVADVVRAGAVDVLALPVRDRTAAAATIGRAVLLAGRVAAGSQDGPAETPTDAEIEAVLDADARSGATPTEAETGIEAGSETGIEATPPPPAEPPPPPGRVITVASASGGSGKTFFATNLAWFLHHRGGRRVCIVDLDLQFGEVTSSLRLQPESSIIDLIRLAGDDDEALAAHLPAHCTVAESGIHVLPAPLDPTLAHVVHPDHVDRVIEAARRVFDDVVVDTPPALTDTVVTAISHADELVVMATLDVPSIRNLHVFLGTLDRLGVADEGARLLLNKAERGSGIEMEHVAKMFSRPFEAALPYAREVPRSVNVGRTVLEADPDAEISRQLGDVLGRLLPEGARPAHAVEARPSRRRRSFRRAREAV